MSVAVLLIQNYCCTAARVTVRLLWYDSVRAVHESASWPSSCICCNRQLRQRVLNPTFLSLTSMMKVAGTFWLACSFVLPRLAQHSFGLLFNKLAAQAELCTRVSSCAWRTNPEIYSPQTQARVSRRLASSPSLKRSPRGVFEVSGKLSNHAQTCARGVSGGYAGQLHLVFLLPRSRTATLINSSTSDWSNQRARVLLPLLPCRPAGKLELVSPPPDGGPGSGDGPPADPSSGRGIGLLGSHSSETSEFCS